MICGRGEVTCDKERIQHISQEAKRVYVRVVLREMASISYLRKYFNFPCHKHLTKELFGRRVNCVTMIRKVVTMMIFSTTMTELNDWLPITLPIIRC